MNTTRYNLLVELAQTIMVLVSVSLPNSFIDGHEGHNCSEDCRAELLVMILTVVVRMFGIALDQC